MKTKKILLFTMLFSLFCMVGVSAQNQRGKATPEKRAALMTERMKTSLKLTDDQTAKIQAINLQLVQDRMAAREKEGDIRSENKDIQKKYVEELKKILTVDQMKTYMDNIQQMKTRFNGSGSGNTPN